MMCFWAQAQQEIPEWLDALASDSFGSGGFTDKSSQFRDARCGNVGISFNHCCASVFVIHVYFLMEVCIFSRSRDIEGVPKL